MGRVWCGAGQTSKKEGEKKVGAKKGGAKPRKSGGPKGGALEGGGARNFSFFPYPAPNFAHVFSLSLWGLLVELWPRCNWGLLVELWPRFKAMAHPKCAFGLLWGHFVRRVLRARGFQTPPKYNEKNPLICLLLGLT